MAELKSVGAITLFVEDLRRAREFYARVFTAEVFDEEEMNTVILRFDNVFVRLLERGEAEREMLGVPLAPAGTGAAFQLSTQVDDAEAARAELEQLGVAIDFGPVDRPWGIRHVGFRDPDGYLWVLSQHLPPPS